MNVKVSLQNVAKVLLRDLNRDTMGLWFLLVCEKECTTIIILVLGKTEGKKKSLYNKETLQQF